ncbi:hypothetical protein [Sphingobacterium multivorum]|nr:hypothetical protein [Sphingobacterium multivorum]
MFTVSSFLCGNATNIWELVAFRFIQGMGGGSVVSNSADHYYRKLPEGKT